ncbi:sugar phosphate isomerase/epimerase family protein [Nocardia sp. alder85J]|uniref:sugar phosphate isomerase/epimerase family protein n=1 Tax=Nocardia sp. alder85J TaxID=2862949 RepID=UPI001CD69337|nr:hypothetical protein [Nocardia sp. alder85J]MCX4097023.1 hypothetical protein [Nocardia sp. alder85J]
MSGPRLELFNSLWAMEDLPYGGDRPWRLDEQLDLLEHNGFDGLAVDLGARLRPEAARLAAELRGRALRTAVFAFVGDDADLDTALRYAHLVDADRMVVCGRVFDDDPRRVAAVLEHWQRRCAAAGVAMQLETHRHTLTEDPRRTVALLEVLDPSIRLAVDLSHYVCGSEIPLPVPPELDALLNVVLARAESVQGRVATRCQVQIPLGFPQHREWEEQFSHWWIRAFTAVLRHRGSDPEPVLFCTELGTTPYAITGRDGRELSDRWADTLTLRDRAVAAFAAARDRLALTPGGIS